MTHEGPKLTPEACRAGRAILRWTVADLAANARVGAGIVAKVEHGGPIQDESRQRILMSFKRAGVEIVSEDGATISWSTKS
jgi:hypothetical protein